jgi:superfamily II DNA or RNA helicase
MLMAYHNGEPFINNVITVIKRAKSVIDYDGKILILVPLLSIIKRIVETMKQDPYFSKYTVAAVDGSMPLRERKEAMESNFILSTSLSMGTGVDVSNLGVVVNFDQYSSAIIGEQIFGRLRDSGKETYYVDICDHVRQAGMLKKWGDKRRMLIPYYPGAKSEMKRFPKIVS